MRGIKRSLRKSVKMCRMAALAAAAFVFFCGVLPVSAAGEGYSYTVRIYAGTKGAFRDGDPEVKVLTVPADSSVSFAESDIALPDGSRYYVKGIRKSGADKLSNNFFRVNEDVDYVVAYGVKGDLVSYRVTFVDEDGNELAPPKEAEGNVGDTPIVGHLPIEGYRPQAYNLTRTLRAEGGNEFIFRYTRIPTEGAKGADTVREEVETVTNTETVMLPGNPDTEGPVTTTTMVNTDASTTVVGPNEDMTAAESDDVEAGQDEAEMLEEPQELVNLDDEETPLAGVEDREAWMSDGKLLEVPSSVYVGLISLIVLFAAGLYFIIVRKMKKEIEKETKTGKDEWQKEKRG